MQAAVERAFKEWKAIDIGLTFERVKQPAEAVLRVTFRGGPAAGSYSYVGTDNLLFKSQETMNFGWVSVSDSHHTKQLRTTDIIQVFVLTRKCIRICILFTLLRTSRGLSLGWFKTLPNFQIYANADVST
jgi:hypothetical protein